MGRKKLTRYFIMICISLCLASVSFAEISTDGSLGPKGPVAGPNYVIPDSLGQTRASSLFHSFNTFNINTGESATFTGPSNIQNVISRVTGGSPSGIDGLLRCTIDGANLYLMNPSGVMFGPNASLDVKGSFHVSTADYLKFGDGGVFYADPANSSSVLSVAAPEAFGFLSANPAAISLDRSLLKVPDGKTISIVGGDISVQNDPTAPTYFDYVHFMPGTTYYTVSAPGGKINLASVASPGEINLSAPDISSFAKPGNITLTNGANLNVSSSCGITPAGTVVIRGGRILFQASAIDATGSRGGAIDIKGETIQLDNSAFNSYTDYFGTAADTGGEINISADNFTLTGGSAINVSTLGAGNAGSIFINTNNLEITDRGRIYAFTYGAGKGGDIHITAADSVKISGTAIQDDFTTGIFAPSLGNGDGGSIFINTNSLDITDRGRISAATLGAGKGGDIYITAADYVKISGRTNLWDIGSGIISASLDKGNGGSIYVNTNNLEITDGAGITDVALGAGNAGDIHINAAGSVKISGTTPHDNFTTGIIALSLKGSEGNAGSIFINTNNLEIIGRGSINAASKGAGNAGDIHINAADSVKISGTTPSIITTAISAAGEYKGNGGSIFINTNNLEITEGATISATTIGTGNGGDIHINAADSVKISSQDGYPSGIYAFSYDKGDGGTIFINTNNLEMIGPVDISTCTVGTGKGGDIYLDTSKLYMTDYAMIYSASFTSGNAGNITVNGGEVNISRGSRIFADSFGNGDSGNINITANSMSISGYGGSTPPYPVPDFTVLPPDYREMPHFPDPRLNLVYNFTGLSTTTNAGHGGTINVALTGDLSLTNQAGIKADTQGTGLGGAININAQNVLLNGNSSINASSSGAGEAGNVNITAANSLLMRNSSITTEAMLSDGGNINISVPYMVKLDDSRITASVGGGPQTVGGNITIDPEFVILKNSQIIANAYEGHGGNIKIVADTFLADPDSIVDASSSLGISGTVDIQANITNVSGLVTPLSTEFVSAAALLKERCIARIKGGKYSSFVIGGRDGLPIEPGNLLPGFLW